MTHASESGKLKTMQITATTEKSCNTNRFFRRVLIQQVHVHNINMTGNYRRFQTK